MSDEKCHYSGCDEYQFEDWYYCERHARAMALVERAFGSAGR